MARESSQNMLKATLIVVGILAFYPSLAFAQADFSGDWELVEGIPDSPLFRSATSIKTVRR